MFDEKDLKAYKEIKAPTNLKAEIEKTLLQNEKQKTHFKKSFISLAASFVVVISVLIFVYLSSGKVSLMYDGKVIENTPVTLNAAVSYSRTASSPIIAFEVNVKEETTISVSTGCVMKEEGDPFETEITISNKGKTTLYLSCFDITDTPLKLTLKTEKQSIVYTVDYNENLGFTIYKDAEK